MPRATHSQANQDGPWPLDLIQYLLDELARQAISEMAWKGTYTHLEQVVFGGV